MAPRSSATPSPTRSASASPRAATPRSARARSTSSCCSAPGGRPRLRRRAGEPARVEREPRDVRRPVAEHLAAGEGEFLRREPRLERLEPQREHAEALELDGRGALARALGGEALLA